MIFNDLFEDCWSGYRQAGMKKKGDRMVPNCVPTNEESNIDKLEQRRIDDLNYKMDEIIARIRSKRINDPDVLKLLMKQFEKLKTERDSYYTVKDYSSLDESHADTLKDRIRQHEKMINDIRISDSNKKIIRQRIKQMKSELQKLEEAKSETKLPKPRDPNWKTMAAKKTSGAAGAHDPKSYTRKEKHKKRDLEIAESQQKKKSAIQKSGAKCWLATIRLNQPGYTGYADAQTWAPSMAVARQMIQAQYKIANSEIINIKEVKIVYEDNNKSVDEGWQDFNKVEPYAVCLAGKPVKQFDYYQDARRFHDNWKKKLYREGNTEKADKITLMPIFKEEKMPSHDVDPILYKAMDRMTGPGYSQAKIALATEMGLMKLKTDTAIAEKYIPQLEALYNQEHGLNEDSQNYHEYNDEADMAYNNLYTIGNAAQGLMSIIQQGDNLPEWCQEKLSLAEDYLVTVWNYIQAEKSKTMGGISEDTEKPELKDGEYFVWVAHFDDGSKKRVRVKSADTNLKKYFANKGDVVVKVDYDFTVHKK